MCKSSPCQITRKKNETNNKKEIKKTENTIQLFLKLAHRFKEKTTCITFLFLKGEKKTEKEKKKKTAHQILSQEAKKKERKKSRNRVNPSDNFSEN